MLFSDACRTSQTCEIVISQFPASPGTEALRDLYLASPGTLLAMIEKLGEDVGCALVIGHNPGMEELLHYLISPRTAHPRLTQGFPTCALAQICLPDKPLEPGSGHLARLEFVRQIEDQP